MSRKFFCLNISQPFNPTAAPHFPPAPSYVSLTWRSLSEETDYSPSPLSSFDICLDYNNCLFAGPSAAKPLHKHVFVSFFDDAHLPLQVHVALRTQMYERRCELQTKTRTSGMSAHVSFAVHADFVYWSLSFLFIRSLLPHRRLGVCLLRAHV